MKIIVPKLRFKEFNDEWKQNKFSNLITLQRGSSPRPIQNFITKDISGINWIKIGDISLTDKYITNTAEKITLVGAEKSRKVYKNEIILSNSMSFGRAYILKIDGCIHDGWFVLRNFDNVFNIDFLALYLSSEIVQKQYKKLAAGGVVSNISSDLVNKVSISYPNKKEQEKIGKLFNLLDKKIELQKQKIEALKLYSESFKKQIF